MRLSSLIIGLFAPTALAFPFVPNKRDTQKGIVVRDVYHYATVIVTVTPTPIDLATFEEYGYGYRRHRNTISRQGSPTPTVRSGVLTSFPSLSGLPSFDTPSVTPTIENSLVTDISQVGTSEGVFTIETAPSTLISTSGAFTSGTAPSTPTSTSVVSAAKTAPSTPISPSAVSTAETAPSTPTDTSAVSTSETVLSTPTSTSAVSTAETASSTPISTSEVFPIETATPTPISTSEVFPTETATPTPISTSFASPQTIGEQVSSTTNDPETAQTTVAGALPSTFVPNLDPTSAIYKGLVLEHHNIHRRNHSAADLNWNDTLAGYAETTAQTCIWGHSLAPGGGGYGQNIAAGTPVGNITAILTNGFYNGELPLYPEFGTNNPNTALFEKWGHFSQVVWKSTKSVGCYTAICSPPGESTLDCKPDGTSYLSGLNCGNGGILAIFTVCNYYPAGNVGGQYTNVGAPLSGATVFVNGDGVQGL